MPSYIIIIPLFIMHYILLAPVCQFCLLLPEVIIHLAFFYTLTEYRQINDDNNSQNFAGMPYTCTCVRYIYTPQGPLCTSGVHP